MLKKIIMLILILTGIYLLFLWLKNIKQNPENAAEATNSSIANEIESSNHGDSVVYDTTYNIDVEAPVMPEVDTNQLMDDLIDAMKNIQDDPLPDATGGADKISTTSIGSGAGSTPISTVKPPSYSPPTTNQVTQTVNAIKSDPISNFVGW